MDTEDVENDNIEIYSFKKHGKKVMDADKIIFSDSDEEPYPKEFWKSVSGFVYISDRKVIGYIVFKMYKQILLKDQYKTTENNKTDIEIQIELVGVMPAYQGYGIGSALIRHLISTHPKKAISVAVERAKLQNISFYRKHEFYILGEFEGQEDELFLMYRPATIQISNCAACFGTRPHLMDMHSKMPFCSRDCLRHFVAARSFRKRSACNFI